MSVPRAPWWIYLVAGAFLARFVLVVYTQWFELEPLGVVYETRTECVVAQTIPGSPATRAGVRAGDRIVAANGISMRTLGDWFVFLQRCAINQPFQLELERGSQRIEVAITLGRRVSAADFIWQFAGLITLVIAFVICFRRPYDLVCRIGAWGLATLANAPYELGPYFNLVWRQLPAPLAALVLIPEVSDLLFGGTAFTFFAVFPRRLFRSRWVWSLIWAPVLFAAVVALPTYKSLFHPEQLTHGTLRNYGVWAVIRMCYGVAALTVLVLNYRRLEDRNEKRRLGVLLAGTLAGGLALIIYAGLLIARQTSPAFRSSPLLITALSLVFLALPVSFAYAILRHRVFDLGAIIRQGLRYALARRLLLSAVPALGAALVLDLLIHGNQSILVVLSSRGWVYATLAILAAVAYRGRQRWLDALDRRFFRESYDAQLLLRETVEAVCKAKTWEAGVPQVVARIEAALHSEFVALLVREPGDTAYRVSAATPADKAPLPLPAGSKFVALIRLLGKPLELPHSDSGWLQQQLPQEETDLLRRSGIDLFVPVADGTDRKEALLALGAKRSEEPYSREDQSLLGAIAASLALLLQRPAPASATVESAFEECPECGVCYDSGSSRCTRDAAALVPTPLPRLLSERYFLERRLGKGGMGTVYEATDRALERRVAAKVIRDDLVGSAEMAERFRREARAAAGFAHPNVVTVHDFGVAAGSRAFLVMELLEGVSLREALRRHGRMPTDRGFEILRGVCAAVDAAHRRQLIHRDLKPENIFLAREENAELAKVLDFGVAKFLPGDTQATVDSTTGVGVLIGTLRYMSPEQLRGEEAGPSWDLWALAAVAYEMLVGRHPFERAKPNELSRAILSARFIPVSEHLPDAPSQWQAFFSAAFALDPTRRPCSAGVLFSELRAAAA